MINLKTGKEFETANATYDNLVRKLRRNEALFGIGHAQLCVSAGEKARRGQALRTAAIGGGQWKK